jgi:hypothetical protein
MREKHATNPPRVFRHSNQFARIQHQRTRSQDPSYPKLKSRKATIERGETSHTEEKPPTHAMPSPRRLPIFPRRAAFQKDPASPRLKLLLDPTNPPEPDRKEQTRKLRRRVRTLYGAIARTVDATGHASRSSSLYTFRPLSLHASPDCWELRSLVTSFVPISFRSVVQCNAVQGIERQGIRSDIGELCCHVMWFFGILKGKDSEGERVWIWGSCCYGPI